MQRTKAAKRKGDALFEIHQDNLARKIQIDAANRAAEKMTGYAADELKGKDFETILAARVRNSLDAYLDFDDPALDFASVARKIPDFTVINKDGKEVRASLKVFYLMAEDINRPQYELLMRDITLLKRMEELKSTLSNQNVEEDVDKNTGLVNSDALKNALEAAYSFIKQDPIEITFAIAAIDNLGDCMDQYGETVAFDLIGKAGQIIQKTCREDDVVAHIGEGDIGFMLLDCNRGDASSVLARVRKNLTSKPIVMSNGREIRLRMSMAFIQLETQYQLDDMYDATRQTLLEVQEKGGNNTSEV